MPFTKKVKPEKLSFSDHDYHRSGSPNENEENGEEEDDTGSDSDQEENEEQEQYDTNAQQGNENLADEEAEDFVMMGMDDHIAGTVRAFPRWVQIGECFLKTKPDLILL
jgi:hypothetical protein